MKMVLEKFFLEWSDLPKNQISDKPEYFEFFRKIAILTQNKIKIASISILLGEKKIY